jgi:glycosyltransferase involved in cell wall biosynthesis
MLGIGVITYKRLSRLQRTIARIQKFTRGPYFLVVADDGGTDETAEWCKQSGITVVTGENRGVCWNKNRALYALHQRTKASEIIVLEDDCYPDWLGWDTEWCWAAMKFHHINYAHNNWPDGWCKGGIGTYDNPYRSWEITGQATITTRRALDVVGFLNTRFKGYGYGHIEWTERFCKAGYFSRDFVPCIRCGLVMEDAETFRNQDDVNRNWKLGLELRATPFSYTPPWQDKIEQGILYTEIAEAIKRQPLLMRN